MSDDPGEPVAANRRWRDLHLEMFVVRHHMVETGVLVPVYKLTAQGGPHAWGEIEGTRMALVNLARFLFESFNVEPVTARVQIEHVAAPAAPAAAPAPAPADPHAAERASLLRTVR